MSAVLGLHQALRTAVALRDKVVVLRLVAASYGTPERVDELGVNLALLRALGLRLIVLLDAAAPAARLTQAIAGQGQRALMLPATGIIGAVLPASGGPALPMLPVTVDAVPLGQLTTIGYVPILLLPVLDQAGVVVNLAADEVAAAVGLYLDAALIVFARPSLTEPAALPLLTAGRKTLVTSAESPEGLVSAILLAGMAVSPAPEKAFVKARPPRRLRVKS